MAVLRFELGVPNFDNQTPNQNHQDPVWSSLHRAPGEPGACDAVAEQRAAEPRAELDRRRARRHARRRHTYSSHARL